MNKEKVWIKPELTVLVRSKPEEPVLSYCKTDAWGGIAGPGGANGCWPFKYHPDDPADEPCKDIHQT